MLLHDDAESLFKNHFEKMTSAKDEPHSLEKLVENIEREVTGEQIWRKYDEVVGDKEVSTDCFH